MAYNSSIHSASKRRHSNFVNHSESSVLLPEVRHIADEASARILAVYDTDFSVQHKDDRSPLTAADMAAHETIVRGLKALTPDIPILSEESAAIDFSTRRQWSKYWLVDPLDGTREFVKRNGEFTVNIALVDNHDSVLGVVLAPVTGVCYFAAVGCGAFRAAAGAEPVAIRTRRACPGQLAIAGSRSHGSEKLQLLLDQLDDPELMTIGSSLKSCLVAEGRLDLYPRFGSTSEWDTAAAQCVVEQAGGLVTNMDFQPLRYNTRESLINPSFLAIGDPNYNWAEHLQSIIQ